MNATSAPKGMKRVVFVCTGNTCRSPMAEGIFRKLLKPAARERVEVLSAGTNAVAGLEPAPHAFEAAWESGIDIGAIRSRAISPELVRSADLLIVMERAHEERLLRLSPGAASKVLLLRDLLPGSDPWAGRDLPDPMGGPAGAYREAFAEIEDALRRGWPEIERRLFGESAPGSAQ